MKKVVIVTGSRADYGIMKKLIQLLYNDNQIDLKIIATAMHMESKYGSTYRAIENDGFEIFKKIPLHMKNSDDMEIIREIALLSTELSKVYSEIHFDLTIILGDRYEMLAAANTSVIYNVPICHLHGGEKTLGNYDEFIRNAITKMSQLHLTSTESYRKRVVQMGEQPNRVINTGSLGVQNVLTEKRPGYEELIKRIGLSEVKKKSYYVVLFHPTTLETIQTNIKIIRNLLSLLTNRTCIFIGSNSDTGSDQIMHVIYADIQAHDNHFIYQSLATEEYHALVQNSLGLLGNSSSGIIEVPSLNVPTLNIGNRQRGRDRGDSVIDSSGIEYQNLKESFEALKNVTDFFNPYQKANSADIAYHEIKKFISEFTSVEKEFYDIKFDLTR